MDTKREHRTHAEGSPRGNPYDLTYSPSGRLIGKSRSNSSVTLSASADMAYGYCDDYQPHAVKRMLDYKNGMLYDMRWDDAGNLGQVSMAKPGGMFQAGRFLFWTEDSRMHAAVDDRYYSYYAYDHSGERRLKLTGDNKLLDVNANFMATYTILNEPTLYPSAYMVLTNKGYTNVAKAESRTSLLALPRRSSVTVRKHYYAGTERVAARLGGGGLDALYHAIGNDEELQVKADMLFKQSLDQVNNRVLQENDLDCIMHNDFAKEEFGHWIDGIPYRMQTGVEPNHDQFKYMMNSMLFDFSQGDEPDVYFYHSDHLGSASWITDFSGMAVQHIQYLPFGERYIDQRTAGYQERFTFTGKERDEETGFGYFGARYYDSELLTGWMSVDPMADKYPSLSPYNYCAGNPVKLVDPDGEDIYMLFYVTGNKGGDGMFKAAAETRKKEIETNKGFNPEKDIVLMFELKDLGQIKNMVEDAVNTYSGQYGRTAEIGVWSHAGWNGPIGSEPTTGANALEGYQMTLNGWNGINFNWSGNANMVFYGCNTGNDYYGTEWVGSFSRDISSLSNYKDVKVWGQRTSAYPSSSPYLRATNLARSIGYGYGIGSTYMVGGNAKQGGRSLWFMPGEYPPANRMNVYKNGRFVSSAFQNR